MLELRADAGVGDLVPVARLLSDGAFEPQPAVQQALQAVGQACAPLDVDHGAATGLAVVGVAVGLDGARIRVVAGRIGFRPRAAVRERQRGYAPRRRTQSGTPRIYEVDEPAGCAAPYRSSANVLGLGAVAIVHHVD